VCYENDASCKFTCTHAFCHTCTKKWIRKGNMTCPMCRSSICFRGIIKKKMMLKIESFYELYTDIMTEMFEGYSDEYQDVFMICLSVIQERFNYTLKKYLNITTDQMNDILRYTWISISTLVGDDRYIIYEPPPYRKFLFVGKTSYAVQSFRFLYTSFI
jgi:hypothetical protein